MTSGFVLVDKQSGWTSHDVVAKSRGILGIRKVGHAGTLDPMATGLLVLGVNRSTRLLRFVQEQPKVYDAVVMFGVATDTLDADGAVLAREPMPVTAREVREALARFRGLIHQVPPMVSARKIEGKRLYELAREGREVEREPRPVEIHELELTDFAPSDYPEASLRVRCSKGTYIRTLAEDIARSLGGHAHLTALRRTAIGSLCVDAARTLDGLAAAVAGGDLDEVVLAPADALGDLPAVTIGADLERGVRNGVALAGSIADDCGLAAGDFVRVLDSERRLLAVYRAGDRRLVPEVVTA